MKPKFVPAVVARNLANRRTDTSNLPKCAVRGILGYGMACGSVIVGGKLCGSSSDCEHKLLDSQTNQE